MFCTPVLLAPLPPHPVRHEDKERHTQWCDRMQVLGDFLQRTKEKQTSRKAWSSSNDIGSMQSKLRCKLEQRRESGTLHRQPGCLLVASWLPLGCRLVARSVAFGCSVGCSVARSVARLLGCSVANGMAQPNQEPKAGIWGRNFGPDFILGPSSGPEF